MSKGYDFDRVIDLISSENKEKILLGLEEIEKNIDKIPAEVVEDVIASLFFIDLGDHPEMVDVKDKATRTLSMFGVKVIPFCLKSLEDADMKAALNFARVLGYVGGDVIEPLIEEYYKTDDPDTKSFILYAMSKVKDKDVKKAVPLVISAMSSDNKEVRDTATRTIGKFFEILDKNDVDEILIETIFNLLFTRIADPSAPIRAKAVRSLGKMAKKGVLNDKQKEKVKKACERILGKDENFEWDKAFIVRKEAKETLKYV